MDYDAIVVGGGPGGSAAAIACAQANLRVLLLEKLPFPRDRPGETLHPGIEPLLKQLGVIDLVLSAGFLRHRGHWVNWDNGLKFIPFGQDNRGKWQGFQAWRAEFDQILLNQANALGVETLQPCFAYRPIVYNNRVTGIETSQGMFNASFVIDAAGSHHWLAKQLGLKVETYSSSLIAHYGYAQGQCPIRDDAPAIIADLKGWTWTAKIGPELYQWTRLNFKNERVDRNWMPEEFSSLKPMGKKRVADATWRMADRPAGLGYFLVGDAAAVLDPASSHGVLKAIMSGMMAAHLIVQSLKLTVLEPRMIQTYCDWVRDWFQHDVEKLKQFYGILPLEYGSPAVFKTFE
jgi:flavin-dependent dehydrogenase